MVKKKWKLSEKDENGWRAVAWQNSNNNSKQQQHLHTESLELLYMLVVDVDDDDDVDDDSSLDMIYLASKPYFRVGKMIALQTMKIKVEKTFIHNNSNNNNKRHRTEPTSNHSTQRESERERVVKMWYAMKINNNHSIIDRLCYTHTQHMQTHTHTHSQNV